MAGQDQAPWFFLWIQDLLHFGDPLLFGVLIPLLLLGLLTSIPYIFPKLDPQELGSWFPTSGRLAQGTTVLIILILLILTIRAV